MKILDNKEIKIIGIISIATIILFVAILSIITIKQNNEYRRLTNEVIFSILGTIKQEYPNVNEEEIIKILDGTGNTEEGQEIAQKYGIYAESSVIKEVEHQEKIMLFLNILILSILWIILIIIFYFYLRYRQKKINELTNYVEEIANKNYSLAIEENSEDELNSLKNELYKITVMLKEQAEQSKEQKEALSTAVSDISHQLKTPLTSILILLDNLSESDNMDKTTREKFLSEIARQIEGMNWLVVSLLKLSKLDAGAIEFENQEINVKELIRNIISNLEIMSELKNVSFEITSNKECYFKGDYNWNKEAIQNIIKNAIEHTKENSKIIISIEENNVYTQISIQDQGEGINSKDIGHIFERFYKAQNASEKRNGIRLSLAKSIIEEQNGYIEVESKKGKGTTFKIKYIK